MFTDEFGCSDSKIIIIIIVPSFKNLKKKPNKAHSYNYRVINIIIRGDAKRKKITYKKNLKKKVWEKKT